jgi:hypothetical protein
MLVIQRSGVYNVDNFKDHYSDNLGTTYSVLTPRLRNQQHREYAISSPAVETKLARKKLFRVK